ncbi:MULTISPECIES: 3-hydroxyacyl-CoA dehydrogenase family protein [Paenibacillus]|uniref:3-hydroxybutyryl-CoA dehydrogenase n=1 Tax=Paenibacillus naphthalenovorans TaxID=162209 RepID=A0A0U2KY51_9BACL|nr:MULTISPECIES: 3-hydroxyacyl-CoA dehydrogenase family protein [Paenibacillus]ALS21826.1 3-hydroxybutyryl-CoA dehydrogenase [Paenibacillus naphthalenovorans]GCL71558.1 3-hydroxybutyryl-CoA dehydrogenase [Paenibacillus naphthalenovorans]
MNIQRIGVVGSGTMGGAIAHLAALSGFQVILCDVADAFLNKARQRMETLMDKSVEKGKMTADQKAEVLSRIVSTTRLEDLKPVQVVIEAIIENLEAKKELFHQLDELLPPDVLIASNTSSMSVTVLAEATKRQHLVAGMHFFNPPQVMKLVEVVRGFKTGDDTVRQLKELAIRFGKDPIEVKKDSPGFIVNRVMIPQFIEAIRLVEEGVASPEDVDKAIVLGLNYPMGPFTLQDFAGVDIGLNVMDYFYEEFKDDRFAAPLSLRRLVRAGRLGKKTGAGWYDYNK